jgi:hypothetical protein
MDTVVHIVAVRSQALRSSVRHAITDVGGSLIEFPHPAVLLASLSRDQAAAVSAIAGVSHIAAVEINRTVHRLQVVLDENGQPDARYVVRNNDLVRVDRRKETAERKK